MKSSLRQQLERLALRLAELDATLADPKVAADMKRFRELSREEWETGAHVSECTAGLDGAVADAGDGGCDSH